MNPAQSSRLLKQATRASVLVSITLVCVKSYAWLMTGSVSVFASLLDSLMDTAASLINLFAVDYSLKPADENHRFGHGKAEALASLAQALIIASTAIYLIYHAIERFVAPQPILHVAEAIWVIVFAIVVTLVLVTFQKYVVKHTASTAVRADSLHYVSDLFTNVATLAALFLTQFGIVQADGFFGLCIGVYILYCAVKVGWSGVRILMDEELPDHERQPFLTCVENTDGVVGVRRMRSWRSGLQRVVQLDVEFDGSRSLVEINENIKLVLRRLSAQDANADVSINPLPVTGVTALSYETKTSAEYQPDE